MFPGAWRWLGVLAGVLLGLGVLGLAGGVLVSGGLWRSVQLSWLWRGGEAGEVVFRRRFLVLGGRPAVARRWFSAWRVFQAVRMRWLRMACRAASQSALGVRPMRRHQPRAMVLPAGSLMVEKPRSALVRRV